RLGDSEGNQTVGWGDNNESTITQELFHAFQEITENKELYENSTITDKEAEGEVATYYIMQQVGDKTKFYFPMGGIAGIKPSDEGSNVEFVMHDVFNHLNNPSGESESVNLEKFNDDFQSYKEVFVEHNKKRKERGENVHNNYTGPVTNERAV